MIPETHSQYRSEIQALRMHLGDARKGEVVQRSIMSANLLNLMPSIPVEKHKDVIDNIFFFQKWAIKDQNNIGLIEQFMEEGAVPRFSEINNKPTIFCSYHLGSYRLLIPYLIRKGVSITLLIDSTVARMQADDFRAAINIADPCAIGDGRFEILDTSRTNLMIAMIRSLRRGHSLVVFIDGNSSVNGNEADPESMVALQFLGQAMFARKGVAFLSHLSGASITPVLLWRGGDGHWENHIRWYQPIMPTGQERGSYVQETIAQLYSILEEALPRHFEQWESWRYVERSLASRNAEVMREVELPKEISQEANLLLNTVRYAKFKLNTEQYLLFDRRSYQSLFISEAFSAFLDGFVVPRTVEFSLRHPSMTPKALHGLIIKEILIFKNI